MQQRNQAFRGVQDLLGKELCSDVLSVMATVLWTLSRLGTLACAELRDCAPGLQSAAPVTILTSGWSRDSRTVLANIWYLSCASSYYQNPSHDQQPRLCCSSPISFQGEGSARPSQLGLRPMAKILLRMCLGWWLQPPTIRTGTVPGNLGGDICPGNPYPWWQT